MSEFFPATVRLSGEFELERRCDDVFPLFSPLGEKAWVPGWSPELLHPAGETWARGLIFRTQEASGEAVWVVTRLDRDAHTVEYHRVESARYVARIEVTCAARGDRSRVQVVYEFVGLSPRGNADIAAMNPDEYEGKMHQWSTWIGAHLESAS